jgi:hypothetical protein
LLLIAAEPFETVQALCPRNRRGRLRSPAMRARIAVHKHPRLNGASLPKQAAIKVFYCVQM